MIRRFYAWILPIKPIRRRIIGWKWYGGYGVVDRDWVFRLEEDG